MSTGSGSGRKKKTAKKTTKKLTEKQKAEKRLARQRKAQADKRAKLARVGKRVEAQVAEATETLAQVDALKKMTLEQQSEALRQEMERGRIANAKKREAGATKTRELGDGLRTAAGKKPRVVRKKSSKQSVVPHEPAPFFKRGHMERGGTLPGVQKDKRPVDPSGGRVTPVEVLVGGESPFKPFNSVFTPAVPPELFKPRVILKGRSSGLPQPRRTASRPHSKGVTPTGSTREPTIARMPAASASSRLPEGFRPRDPRQGRYLSHEHIEALDATINHWPGLEPVQVETLKAARQTLREGKDPKGKQQNALNWAVEMYQIGPDREPYIKAVQEAATARGKSFPNTLGSLKDPSKRLTPEQVRIAQQAMFDYGPGHEERIAAQKATKMSAKLMDEQRDALREIFTKHEAQLEKTKTLFKKLPKGTAKSNALKELKASIKAISKGLKSSKRSPKRELYQKDYGQLQAGHDRVLDLIDEVGKEAKKSGAGAEVLESLREVHASAEEEGYAAKMKMTKIMQEQGITLTEEQEALLHEASSVGLAAASTEVTGLAGNFTEALNQADMSTPEGRELVRQASEHLVNSDKLATLDRRPVKTADGKNTDDIEFTRINSKTGETEVLFTEEVGADGKKTFRVDPNPNMGPPDAETRIISVPKLDDNGIPIPGAADILEFDHEGECIAYNSHSEGRSQIDPQWLKKQIAVLDKNRNSDLPPRNHYGDPSKTKAIVRQAPQEQSPPAPPSRHAQSPSGTPPPGEATPLIIDTVNTSITPGSPATQHHSSIRKRSASVGSSPSSTNLQDALTQRQSRNVPTTPMARQGSDAQSITRG